MVRQGFRTGWMAALLALAIAVFAFAPTVEAATCGFEPVAEHSVSVHDDASGEVDAAGKSHGPCSHGHCHHATSIARHGEGLSIPLVVVGAGLSWPADDARLSRIPGGLERPPRA